MARDDVAADADSELEARQVILVAMPSGAAILLAAIPWRSASPTSAQATTSGVVTLQDNGGVAATGPTVSAGVLSGRPVVAQNNAQIEMIDNTSGKIVARCPSGVVRELIDRSVPRHDSQEPEASQSCATHGRRSASFAFAAAICGAREASATLRCTGNS
jgi:hypothetical protein